MRTYEAAAQRVAMRGWRVSLLVLRVVKPVRRLAALRPHLEMVGTPQCASCHFCTISPQKPRDVAYNVAAAGWSVASVIHAEGSIALWTQPLASSPVTSINLDRAGHRRIRSLEQRIQNADAFEARQVQCISPGVAVRDEGS